MAETAHESIESAGTASEPTAGDRTVDDRTATITVTYFAALIDRTGCRREDLPVATATVGGLREAVAARHGELAGELAALSSVLDGDEMLRESSAPIGADVDLLPPFAGG